MEGQEKHSNLQDREPNWEGGLSHALHENHVNDPRADLQAPATTMINHQKHGSDTSNVQDDRVGHADHEGQLQNQNVNLFLNQQKGGKAKDIGAVTSSNGSKSKNKLNKKRRDPLKKKLAEVGNVVPEISEASPVDVTRTTQMEGTCKKCILVEEQIGMTITPIRVQQANPPSEEPLDVVTNICHSCTTKC